VYVNTALCYAEVIFQLCFFYNCQSSLPSSFTRTFPIRTFTETLRKYPVIPFPDHMFCNDYKLPALTGNGTITFPAGSGIYIILYWVCTMTRSTSPNRKSLIQTVSQRKTNTVDRNTHTSIFHLARVRECASVRIYSSSTYHYYCFSHKTEIQ